MNRLNPWLRIARGSKLQVYQIIAIPDCFVQNFTLAKFMGLKVTGTLGVLLKAKKEGLIERVEPILNSIIADGFYIASDIRQMVLEEAGEL